MRERPVDIRDSDVAAALTGQWVLTVQDMFYLPVGFGGYHWLAVDHKGSRWFVTVSDLATPWVSRPVGRVWCERVPDHGGCTRNRA